MSSKKQDRPLVSNAVHEPTPVDIVITENARVTLKKMPQIADQEDSDIM